MPAPTRHTATNHVLPPNGRLSGVLKQDHEEHSPQANQPPQEGLGPGSMVLAKNAWEQQLSCHCSLIEHVDAMDQWFARM